MIMKVCLAVALVTLLFFGSKDVYCSATSLPGTLVSIMYLLNGNIREACKIPCDLGRQVQETA